MATDDLTPTTASITGASPTASSLSTSAVSSAPPASAASCEADSPVSQVRGACAHDCPDTCATITEVRDGQAVRFFADPDHLITQGWLCAKVRPYLERVYSPDRLLSPLRR